MTITAVERLPKRRGRVQVYVDGIAAFEIAATTALASDLRPGRVIDQPAIDAIMDAEHRRQAMQAAAAMLARRPHSEREIRRRLAQRKCDPTLIDQTIARLREMKLIDDAEFARTWTESRDRTSPRGRRLIVQELRTAGVDQTIAGVAATAISDEDAAYRLAERRLRSLAALDYDKFRNRLGSLLQRRGFGWATVRTTIDRCWSETHDGAAIPEPD